MSSNAFTRQPIRDVAKLRQKHTSTETDLKSDDLSALDKVFLENHAQDLTKSQKLKQLRIGPFTVTKQITNTTYEIREDANPDNAKTTHRNHLIEYFPKEERLPPLITNYAVISKDSDFYNHLVNSQIEQYNSGKKHSLYVMPFVITSIQNNSEIQQKKY